MTSSTPDPTQSAQGTPGARMNPQAPPVISIDTSIIDADEKQPPVLIEPTPSYSPTVKEEATPCDESDFSSHAEEAQQHLNEDADPSLGGGYKWAPKQLSHLIDPKSVFVLAEMGGLEGLQADLNTNLQSGLSEEDAGARDARIEAYDRNILPEKKAKSLFYLMWMALQDKVLILLTVAAIISLALGLYETFGQPDEYDAQGRKLPKVDWVEGVAIMVAIIIVVVVGAGNDWQKELRFVKLNKKKEDRMIRVIRSGKTQEVPIAELLVGDLVLLEPGDMIPADGILVSGHNIKCDESSATGETDTMKKVSGFDAMTAYESRVDGITRGKVDPFILSGSKVLEGIGTYVVTAVGPNSLFGKTLLSLNVEDEATPLQAKLNDIAEGIAKAGGLAALILFLVLFIRFCARLPGNHDTPAEKGNEFMDILITAITIIVVAVPEGLPLAVTLALAFATTRMLKDNNLVRELRACETMGNATTVCSDKTGTLTENRMTVTRGTIGVEEFSVEHITEFLETLPAEAREILFESIVFNTTAFETDQIADTDAERFVGSKTETALLNFAHLYMGLQNLANQRDAREIIQIVPFDSSRKCMAVVLKMKGFYRMYIKGASEVLSAQASMIFNNNAVSPITPEQRQDIDEKILHYGEQSLRGIALAYRDFECSSWPPKGMASSDDPTQADFTPLFADLTLFGLIGIMDPLREGVTKAVADCQSAGVIVRMVTGDNVNTAKAIARECGIYSDDGLVMEGPVFRRLPEHEMKELLPRLQVLARSSPEDKRILVKALKEMGETVAVTGDGTNDGPALKLADVGFSMGIAGTEVAKEASSIILMDDNFSSIVKAIMWGRTVNDAVKKFLQFQLTVNVTAVVLTFVSAVVNKHGKSVLTAVQLLWVNLIMDTFAALALATDPPSPDVLERKPDRKSQSLITVTMWKMIFGQAIFQLAVTFVLYFAGKYFWTVETPRQHDELAATVFNTFVWMQFFNLFVNRRLDNKMNMFVGIHRNIFFILICAIIGGFQVLIMFVGGAAFSIVHLNGGQWATSLICGVVSLPAGMLIRLVPDAWVSAMYPQWLHNWVSKLWRIMRPKNKEIVEIHVPPDEGFQGSDYKWHSGIEEARVQLEFMRALRGGRMNLIPNLVPIKIRQKFQRSRSNSEVSSLPKKEPTVSMTTASPTQTVFDDSRGRWAENDGHLAVPGATYGAASSPTSPGGSSTRSSSRGSRGSSIGALVMVPAIVGGAVAGWNPELKPPSNNH
ncbi:Calcium-transporting ATPase 2 [Yarrowia sp. B02]|nr:Calcium-transporting ATPase 2 [Yarrowia sp. B02]